jgi:hypothetical protein
MALIASFSVSADDGKGCDRASAAPGPVQSKLEALQADVLAQFQLKGFKCGVPSVKTGLTCIGRIKGYPRDVIIVVPPGYQPREQAEIVLHIHGHNYTDYDANYLNKHFGLATGMAASGRDAILIAPLSLGNCTDFERSLADTPEHFKSFIDESMTLLKDAGLTGKPEPRSLVLTAHSGGYRTVGSILRSGVYDDKIKETYFFDSTYALADQFVARAAKPGSRMWSAYADPSVVTVTEEMQAKLRERQVPYFSGKRLKSLTPEALSQNRIGFVRSGRSHDETFSKYFPVFLAPKR